MEIQKAIKDDLLEVMFLLKECINEMNAKGMYHWNNYYHNNEIILNNILKGNLYIVKDLSRSIGMVTISDDHSQEYETLNWKQTDKKKALVIHMLAVHPHWENKGIIRQLIEFAENFATKHGYKSIRIDAYQNNHLIINTISSKGFVEIGKILSPSQKAPFECFEKIL